MSKKLKLTYYVLLISTPFLLMAFFSIASIGRLSSYEYDIRENANNMLDEGQEIFRHDSFGSESFWGDALKLHTTIAGDSLGGVGPGLSPVQALALGLKVDVDALPQEVRDGILDGSIDLEDPATTLALLELDAVVGIKGIINSPGNLSSVGITCALCHSTVDDSFSNGIGKRLDGWANRDLNVGEIIAFAPDLSVVSNLLGVDEETVRTVARSWGPGKFDAILFMDGKAFRPDGKSASTLLPSAFGLAGVNMTTYTGWGSITHWNAFVGNLEMHGQGTFFDPRLNDAARFPVAAANNFGNVRNDPDLVTSKLAALQFYQLSIQAPKPPVDHFNAAAAEMGEIIFNGKAQCATCHVPPIYTEPGYNMHTPEEIGIDNFQSERSPTGMYRTTPLKGLWTRENGGFYHDGRFETYGDVINHYNNHFNLGLTENEKFNLTEFLKSLGDQDVVVGVFDNESDKENIPKEFELFQNYPNPFNPATTIKYSVPRDGRLKLKVFDILGQEVKTIVDEYKRSGTYEVEFNTNGISSGVYIYKIEAENFSDSKKMIVLK
ncbi:MAG: T9SS type A sorting domain-containing protein [Ignavibacteriae bacterium]|nr:T9SS C-terminal target domain-containing protein [Ignavibacteriota bacterium]NOG97897.1 T9SS type A sorting domain-containing protein [Ignavibacteriota bacterium]